MIGSGYKKFAKNNGMNVASGVAYGALHGYATTLFEGSGFKAMIIVTKFADAARQLGLQNSLDQKQMTKNYRVTKLEFTGKTIQIVFSDTIGTMKKIEAFVEWFFPKLDEFGATKANVCAECGAETAAGCWKLIDGIAYYYHPTCADYVCQSIRQEEQQAKEEDTGTYLRGFVGALLGAALGSVAWALLLALGYIAGLAGLLIGWLADRGYRLLHGKNGKGKIAILIIAVIFGVLLGTILGEGISAAVAIGSGELEGLSFGDIPALLILLMMYDSEFLGAVIMNVVIGLVFAALGVWGTIKSAANEVADTKIIDLP